MDPSATPPAPAEDPGGATSAPAPPAGQSGTYGAAEAPSTDVIEVGNAPVGYTAPQPAAGTRFDPAAAAWAGPAPAWEATPVWEPVPEPSRPFRAPVLIAVAAVLAVLVAGGAYAGAKLWFGSGAQPESVTPASVAGFLRLDLDPGVASGRKLENLLKKFPGDAGSTQARREKIGNAILRALGVEDLKFSTDIEPWFADRIGVAAWTDAEKQPVELVLMASANDGRARQTLTRVRTKLGTDHFGFVLAGGYALLARAEKRAQADAEAAAKEAEQHSLADAKPFVDAVAGLPADQTALGWADLAKVGQLMTEQVGDLAGALPYGDLPVPGELPTFERLTGHFVLGAQAVDNGVEIRLRTTGVASSAAGDNVRPTLDAAAGNAIGAAVVSADPRGASGALASGLGAGLGGMLGLFGDPESAIDPDEEPDPETIRRLEETSDKMIEAMGALLRAQLLGITVTSLAELVPGVLVTANVDAATSARTIGDGFNLFGQTTGVTATVRDNHVEIRSRTYQPSGRLADNPLYREAMAGTPDRPYAAVFVDVTRWLGEDRELGAGERRYWEPIKAIGAGVANDGGGLAALVRVVVK